MDLPIRLVSTDFDGTLFTSHENPPVPLKLQRLLADLQARGVKWVINTGRDYSDLTGTLRRTGLLVQPDYIVVVEREIYIRQGEEYVEVRDWNERCRRENEELFRRIRPDLPKLEEWVRQRFTATVYADAFSPFCFIAESNNDAQTIETHLADYCRTIPNLIVVRNDVYARMSHAAYTKGTALSEIARRLGLTPEQVFAAGDHLNDLTMLSRRHAHHLVAPANAVPLAKEAVRQQNGFVSDLCCGHGVAEGLEYFLNAKNHASI